MGTGEMRVDDATFDDDDIEVLVVGVACCVDEMVLVDEFCVGLVIVMALGVDEVVDRVNVVVGVVEIVVLVEVLILVEGVVFEVGVVVSGELGVDVE